jgi:hypothetical protein
MAEDEKAAEIRNVVAGMYDTQFSTRLEWIDPPEDTLVAWEIEEEQLTPENSEITLNEPSQSSPKPELLTPTPVPSTNHSTPRTTPIKHFSSYLKGVFRSKN